MRHAVNSKATTLLILATLALSPAALADRPRRPEIRRVEALAYELKEAAADLTASARGRRHHFTRSEARALRRLEAFEASARRYYRRVARDRGDLRETWGAFRSTLSAYDRAVRAFDGLHPVQRVKRDLNQVDRIIDRLQRLYDRPDDSRYTKTPPGSGRIRGH